MAYIVGAHWSDHFSISGPLSCLRPSPAALETICLGPDGTSEEDEEKPSKSQKSNDSQTKCTRRCIKSGRAMASKLQAFSVLVMHESSKREDHQQALDRYLAWRLARGAYITSGGLSKVDVDTRLHVGFTGNSDSLFGEYPLHRKYIFGCVAVTIKTEPRAEGT